MVYDGPSIQNGRLRAHRRSAYFSGHLYRISEVIQHPKRITFREVCSTPWLIYASIRAYFCVRSIFVLFGYVDVTRLCGNGQSFCWCCWTMAWKTFDELLIWLGEVVPWAIFCVVLVFLGEVVLHWM